jgi:hypothetical protein
MKKTENQRPHLAGRPETFTTPRTCDHCDEVFDLSEGGVEIGAFVFCGGCERLAAYYPPKGTTTDR